MHNKTQSKAKQANVNADRDTLLRWKNAEKQMMMTVVTKKLYRPRKARYKNPRVATSSQNGAITTADNVNKHQAAEKSE
jgi:hypothetical protein